jgi:hypothetical protein
LLELRRAFAVDDISHEGLRTLLREEGVSFQRLKTWKASKDPRYAAKKARIEQLYAIADRQAVPGQGDPEVIFCVDEFGPLNLQPRPGRQWAAANNAEIAYTPANASWLNCPVHRAAVLRPGRHRPGQPPRAGQHDPPVHHLAEQPRLRRTAPPHR